jgi:hypothetical protein
VTVKHCECGTKYAPQIAVVRIPNTFQAMAYVVVCLGGCHRESVGLSEAQAIESWNASFPHREGGKQ